MAIGIDPLVDFAAKRLLDADKLSILDIKATDSLGRRYNIEVQTTRPLGLPKRLTYYAAKQLVEQLGETEQYANLNPSISICVLDAVMFRSETKLLHAFELRTADGLSLTDCLQVHVIELPKYVIPSHSGPITDPVEQWLYFFREAANCTTEELVRRLSDPIFGEAAGVLVMISRTPLERQAYDDRLKAERDEWPRTAQAKLDGIEQGQRTERARIVTMLRDLVGDVTPADKDLADLPLDELAWIEAEFQQRLRKRN
jgi:predicted transposase/invertase (TIGR01784 family)